MSYRPAIQSFVAGLAIGSGVYLVVQQSIYSAHDAVLHRFQLDDAKKRAAPSLKDYMYESDGAETTPVTTRIADQAAHAWNASVLKVHAMVVSLLSNH